MIPVVSKFLDLFPKDILGLPLVVGAIEFKIDTIPRVELV